jgi:Leucine-rich repeat (LRR) protein
MKQIALPLAFLLIFFLPSSQISAQVNQHDSLILVALYKSANGSGWINHTNWLTSQPVTTWLGVGTTYNDGIHVNTIVLANNNLAGTIPDSICNLSGNGSSLWIDLSGNRLTGSLPSSISNIPALAFPSLKFDHNMLSGAVPVSEFPADAGFLNISYNNFNFSDIEPYVTSNNGFLPGGLTYDSIQADLPLIQNGNTLTIAAGGTISNNTYSWYKDGTLVATTTGDSAFTMTGTGTYAVSVKNNVIPTLTLCSIQNINTQDSLALIDLYNSTGGANWIKNSNWLTSAPAASWNGVTARFGKVQKLYLPYNNLNGSITSSFANLTGATYINFSNNQLNGPLPAFLSSLTLLNQLTLSFNQYTGGIPSVVGNMSALQGLSLDHNPLTGSIPAALGNLSQLQTLDLRNDQFSGGIPAELGNLTNLTELALDSNQLTDTIPSSLGNMKSIGALSLSFNQLTGHIPVSLGSQLTQLYALGINNNQLTGNIPDSLCNMPMLSYLFLQDNQLTGTLPDSIGKAQYLSGISVENNNLSGTIPATLPALFADSVNISGNKYTFSISPVSAQPLVKLTYAPQQNILLTRTEDKLSVSAGGNSAHSTYTLFKDGASIATQTGDSLFTIGGLGNYNIVTTNTDAPQLTLYSDTLKLGLVLPDSTTTTTQIISGSGPVDINTNIFRIATLTPGAGVNALTGSITALETVDTSILTFNNAPYVQRHYDITPALNPTTATATITLYYAQSDFDAYNTYVTSHSLSLPLLPSGGLDNGNIIITQYHGSFIGTSSPANYSQGSELIAPSVAWDATNNWWTLTFPVSGFSGFFLNSGSIPLPLTLLQFTGVPQGYQVNLQWQTTDEQNTKQFIVQRSPDGSSFDPIGAVAARNISGQNQYGFTDTHPYAGNNFYRLKMQDQDGHFTYSPIVQVVIGDLPASCLAYPNPATSNTSLLFNASTATNYSIEISDQNGNVLTRLTGTSAVGLNKIDIDVHSYAPGTYTLTLIDTEHGRRSIRLLKE